MSDPSRPLSRRLRPSRKSIFQLTESQLAARDQLFEKMRSGVYPTEDVGCVICGDAPFTVIAEREQYGLPYRAVMCRTCGLMRTTPRLAPDATAKFYAGEFRVIHGGTDERSLVATFAKKRGLAAGLFEVSRPWLPSEGLVLEIGCGTGANLEPFQRAGYEVAGCDYGARYLEYGVSQGIRGLQLGGADALLPAYEGRADLAILSHVLEHFTDIPQELDRIRRLLKPGGLLLIAVPGLRELRTSKSLGNLLAFLIISHTYHFSLASLTNVMARHGFTLLTGDESIVAVFRQDDSARGLPVRSTYDDDIGGLRSLERRWNTWTLPERFVWTRRHAGIRRRVRRAARLILRSD